MERGRRTSLRSDLTLQVRRSFHQLARLGSSKELCSSWPVLAGYYRGTGESRGSGARRRFSGRCRTDSTLQTNEDGKCSANSTEQLDCECDSSLGLQSESNRRRTGISLRS